MFIWKKEFELGIPTIDVQHKELFNIGNNIYNMISNDIDELIEIEVIYDVINSLKEYTKYHFRTEEDLLIKYNYRDISSHIKEHREFIDYLDSINYENIEDKQYNFLKKLLGKIANWIFNHIITTDYMYKDYLISLGGNNI